MIVVMEMKSLASENGRVGVEGERLLTWEIFNTSRMIKYALEIFPYAYSLLE